MQPILTDIIFLIHNMVLLVNVTLRGEALFSFKHQQDEDIREKLQNVVI